MLNAELEPTNSTLTQFPPYRCSQREGVMEEAFDMTGGDTVHYTHELIWMHLFATTNWGNLWEKVFLTTSKSLLDGGVG